MLQEVKEPKANLVGKSLALTSIFNISNEWIIDTGATDHVCFNLSIFTELPKYNNIVTNISVPTGNAIPVCGIGHARISSNIHLTDVLYVPTFKFNLLSVQKLAKDSNCTVIFFPNYCVFQDLSTKMEIGRGHERNGLYFFSDTPQSTALTAISPSTWHSRFGHPSHSVFKHLISTLGCSDFKDPCDICHMSKQDFKRSFILQDGSRGTIDKISSS